LPEVATWNLLASARLSAARGDGPAAEAAFRRAVRGAADSGYEPVAWFARAELADLLAADRPAEARAEFETALIDVERARSRLAREGWKLTFQERVTRFYRAYVDFLMARGETERALEIAEASRARLLAQKLRLDTESLDIVPAARFRELARTSRAVLVSFWLAPRKSYLWAVTPRGVHAAELPGDAELGSLIDAYAGAIRDGRDPLATASPAGEKLAALLLAPLAKLAPGASRFILVADGALHRLNLETLPSAPGRYWIEDATVAMAPSLALLTGHAAPRPSRDALLVIGNPEQPEAEYPPLPAAAEELAALRKRFHPEVYEGAAAHPAAYVQARPARFSLIHLSAHATANRQSPLESAVILSRRDGRFKLYAREVIDIPIRARLVTISACRSAGARVYTGEGLVGFTWAFLRAGAQNVVAGLWDVNDASTARLMDRLYGEIAAGHPPSQALRIAKLALLRSDSAWRKPFYWAPFQVFSRVPTFFENR
jgi:CHAT domain-containing protein